jgi:hypothetical protein
MVCGYHTPNIIANMEVYPQQERNQGAFLTILEASLKLVKEVDKNLTHI